MLGVDNRGTNKKPDLLTIVCTKIESSMSLRVDSYRVQPSIFAVTNLRAASADTSRMVFNVDRQCVD